MLVSVRSGARVSMPGMMDTVLNLGLNAVTTEGLARLTGDARFAYDSYRRFIQMYSDVVLGVEHSLFEEILDDEKDAKGVELDTDLDADDLKRIASQFKKRVEKELGIALSGRRAGTAVGRHRRGVRLLGKPARQYLSQAPQYPR